VTDTAAAPPRARLLRVSPTLVLYIARAFTLRFLALFAAIAAIILLVSTIEELDQLGSSDDVTLPIAFTASLFKLPFLIQEVMPFAILFAAMATFWRLTRTNELVVARAAGISVWQILGPVLITAVAVGVLTTTVINPMSSVMLRQYEQMESRFSNGGGSTLSVAKTGLWLRQSNADGQAVIHADRVRQSDMVLFNVTVYRFSDAHSFESRLDAERAQLAKGEWVLYDAWMTAPGRDGRFMERTTLPTDLTPDKVYKSFAPPETISFWELPEFVELLENAGFAAGPHELQLHRLLAKPLLLGAMVLLAATFSLRPHRRGGVAMMIVAGVLTGFLIYVLSNIVFALGLSSKLPVAMAAWTPSVVSLMLGVASLLHLEDG
jgi:lipopolysaccharide export system permease protein